MEIKEMAGAMEKMNVGQRDGGAGGVNGVEKKGGGAGCLLCKESCSGLQTHSWSKVCVACGCNSVDHAPGSDADDDQRMGRLLTDSPCSHLTAKVKGAGGLRLYKRNRMTVTNPVVTRKDPSFNTTYYDWTPFGLTQKLAMQYMDSLPEDRRTISGTEGWLFRRRQLLGQLPVYDQDPMKCQSLTSEDEISSMLLFVKGYKQEVLGVGEVALPTEGGALAEAANQRRAKETKDQGSTNSKAEHKGRGLTNSAAVSTNGVQNPDITSECFCTGCHGEITGESLVVYCERAGYHDSRWHPGCFLCSECGQGLVDLVYFWTNQKLLCGRHYCQSVWPRCSGCDELIFCQSFHLGTDGRTWHHDHYCCWRCGQSLDTPCICVQGTWRGRKSSRMKHTDRTEESAAFQRVVLKNASRYHYLKGSLELNNPDVRLSAVNLKLHIITGLKNLYGEVGAAFPFDLLSYDEDSLTFVLRVYSRGLVKLQSSLTLSGFYQNQRCAFRMLQVSPFLLALSGNSRELKLNLTH